MRLIFLVGIGGFTGCIFRYLLSLSIQTKYPSIFPFATLTVNIIGCLAIGIFFGLNSKTGFSKEWILFFVTGICGGFTTYSTFSLETFEMIKNGFIIHALVYIFSSVVIGLLATWAGFSIFRFY